MTNLRQQWLHGFLEMCLLSLLVDGPDYGLGLSERLSASGLGDVPGGTLYPSLLRLEKQGLVSISWRDSTTGPRRKYYELTEQGRRAVRELAASWAQFRAAVDGLTVGVRHD